MISREKIYGWRMINTIQWIIKILRHLFWYFIYMPAFVISKLLSINRLQGETKRERITNLGLLYSFYFLALLKLHFHCFIKENPSLSFTCPHLFRLYMTRGTPMTCLKILQSCFEVKERQKESGREIDFLKDTIWGLYRGVLSIWYRGKLFEAVRKVLK